MTIFHKTGQKDLSTEVHTLIFFGSSFKKKLINLINFKYEQVEKYTHSSL